MIKILFTIPNFDTAGSGKALFNIATSLNKEVFEPYIMCKHSRGAFFKTVENSGMPVIISNYETQMRPLFQGVNGCRKVSRILAQINPDIIHSFHYSADYSEALAAKIAGCKWIFTKKNMNWGGSSKNAWRLRSALADGIIVQNTDMIERFYPKSKKTMLIPRGVNTKIFSRDIDFTSEKFNKNFIICVANLVPVKGIEILIEAFQKIIQKRSDWTLKIVGDDNNEYGDKLKKFYYKLIAQNKLIFTGKVLDVKEELESGSIFVLPTLNEGRMEGSPVSLLEAMSMGLLVIGSKIPGIKDQLQPLGEDHIFEAGKVDKLSIKLEKFISLSESERINLSKRISEYCQHKWDISIEVQRHERFYLKTLGRE